MTTSAELTADERESWAETVRALEAQAVELRAAKDAAEGVVRALIAAYDDPTPLDAPLAEQIAMSDRIDAAWTAARALAVSPSTGAPTKEETETTP